MSDNIFHDALVTFVERRIIKMGDEGQFRFTNGIAIDEKLNKERILDVVNHEFTHSLLYFTTTYGQFMMMLEKNGVVDERSRVLTEALFLYVSRMQERVAVNIEVMLRCVSGGFYDYFDAIDRLKNRNTAYYNHFRKLCCINGKVRNEEDALQLVNVLREVARLALNIDLRKIPFSTFRTEKDVVRFFNEPNNNARFSPNKRFEILINIFFRDNENNNDYKAVYDGSITLDKMEDVEYIHKIVMETMNRMYAEYPIKNRLIRRAESVGIKKAMYFEGAELLSVKPAKINEDKEHYIKAVKSICEFKQILEMQEKKYVYVLNRVRGFEDFQIICIFEEQNNRRISYSFCFLEEESQTLYKLLQSLECIFVFYKTKFMDKERNAVRKMVKKLPVYIFEDTPILSSLDVISHMFYGGKYSYIRRENDSIVIFQKKSILLFANIISRAEKVLDRELKRFNIEYTNVNKIGNIDEILYLDRMCNDYEGNEIENAKRIR